ncbi:MAG TPA: DUF4383 domain-containing protein [Actinomycetota bacterium]|nr:DUF4383 domain-containing protein [Actinomycetota bacterium]
MTLAQKFATTFGGVYVLIGILGFIPALGGTASQTPDFLLGIFGITAAHNVVHLLIGLAFLAASRTDANARMASNVIGAAYILVGILGLLNLDFVNDLLNINGADNVLHFVSGIAALAVGMAGRRGVATA